MHVQVEYNVSRDKSGAVVPDNHPEASSSRHSAHIVHGSRNHCRVKLAWLQNTCRTVLTQQTHPEKPELFLITCQTWIACLQHTGLIKPSALTLQH